VPLWLLPALSGAAWAEGGTTEVVLARTSAVLETALVLWDLSGNGGSRTLAGAVQAAEALEE
jgi:hypothetical protein